MNENMASQDINEWTGLKGMLGAWFLASPGRRLFDLATGNVKPRLLEILAISGDETVLDLGCGSGFYSVPVAQQLDVGRLFCVDAAPVMLRQLERRMKSRALDRRVDIRLGDATSLPLDDESVDLVYSTNLLHELPQPELVLREMWRVSRPGARAVVVDFRDTPRQREFIAKRHHALAHGVWSPQELSDAMSGAGFDMIDLEPRGSWIIGIGEKRGS